MIPGSIEAFGPHLAHTSPGPLALEVAKAEGSYIYSRDGKAYLDLIAGLAVGNVGHRHPHVLQAIAKQCADYLHVIPYGEFVQKPQVDLANKLAALLPERLDSCYFVNSGTEAIEAALKLAKRYTGRHKLVACRGAYHGSTHGSLSISSNEQKKYHVRPLLPEVYFGNYNDPNCLDLIDEHTAAFVAETVQGDAGVRIPSASWLQAVEKRCREVGCMLILDEIQSGFGRTGRLFAFEHFGVVPDILVVAKSLGGGMPMGAFISSRHIMHSLSHDPILGHITTFGGHPVCCAAALAAIEVLEKEQLVAQCEAKGALLESLLEHPAIVEVRRIGLMMAVEFDSAERVRKIVQLCLQRGVITFYFLSCPDSFRIAPPLNISEEEIRASAKSILEAIEAAT